MYIFFNIKKLFLENNTSYIFWMVNAFKAQKKNILQNIFI